MSLSIHHPAGASPQASLKSKYSKQINFELSKHSLSLFFNRLTIEEKVYSRFFHEIANKLRITSHLKSLVLTFQTPVTPNDPPEGAFKKILPLVKGIKRLEKLFVSFSASNASYSQHFKELLKILEASKGLRKLELKFLYMNFMPGKDPFPSFVNQIRSVAPNITSLKLSYASLQGETRSFWFTLANQLKSFRQLALDVRAEHFLTASNVLNFSPIQHLRRLTALNLTITMYEPLVSAGNLSKKSFPNLRHLKISKGKPHQVPAKNITYLTSEFAANLSNLESTSLVLEYKSYEEETLEHLANHLPLKVKNLASLSLTFRSIACNSSMISYINSLLLHPSLESLQALSLNFSGCASFSNNVTKNLAQSITQNLVNLKILSLKLALAPAPPKPKKNLWHDVKDFLGIEGEEGMTNKGLAQFGSILAKEKIGLEKLNIQIEKSLEINDEGVKVLCDELMKIQKIKKIDLGFRDCGNVTPGVENYVKQKTKNLDKINLISIN